MSKAERLIELMITINAKRDFTAGELAKEFSVSKRTILRDLQVLERIGFPLYAEVGAAGGYHVLKERVLPPIFFSESEAKALFFAYQSLSFYRDLPFEQQTVSALKKLLNCLPADMQHSITWMQNKIVFWTPERHCDSPLLREAFDIVMAGLAAKITYSSQHRESARTIIPIGLYAMNGLWYCPAYCLQCKEIREFRVDRMITIEQIALPSGTQYPIPRSICEYLDTIECGADYRIRVHLTDVGVKRCEAEFLLAKGLTVLPDGGYIDMPIAASMLEWVADYFLPFGKDAVVLEPVELIDITKNKIKQLYEQYGASE